MLDRMLGDILERMLGDLRKYVRRYNRKNHR